MLILAKGEIKYYRDFDDVLRVKVIDLAIRNSRNTVGISYTFEVLEVLQTTSECYAPAIGFTFSVWEPIDQRNMSGTHLTDKL